MNLGLKAKRVLVTGSTRGIGKAIAAGFVGEGAKVAVHGRRQEAAEVSAREVVQEVGGKAEQVIAVSGDLSAKGGVGRVFRGCLEGLGGIDVLVNNAGTFEVSGWKQADGDRWLQAYGVNVVSMVRLIRRVVEPMREQGSGRIIQIASISAAVAPPVFPDYAAAKAATVNLTVSLMQELAGTGITVNTISPGPVETATWKDFALQIAELQGWEKDLETVKKKLLSGLMSNASGRLGRPQDVADACLFLASSRSSYINGVNLPVTGGLAARAV
ncbi:MAG TPA: SDR family oxidoreductase [Acidobacteriota bacterium]|nr:SDR family oxidoreductase [Acidobacteriota bacterium]